METVRKIQKRTKFVPEFINLAKRRLEAKLNRLASTSTIPWVYVRRFLPGKTMVVYTHAANCDDLVTAWMAEISNSWHIYALPGRGNPIDPHDLRIIPAEGKMWKTTDPPVGDPKPVWCHCEKIPRVIVRTRMIDCRVTNDEAVNVYNDEGYEIGQKVLTGGDIWCFLEIPDELQRPGGPYCRRGILVVSMGKDAPKILAEARRLERERYRPI